MTYLTLSAINSNNLFAPIGDEDAFKRRIFLDNFKRCMTIRSFQKTAGVVIREKLNTHPTAKMMKPIIEEWHKVQEEDMHNGATTPRSFMIFYRNSYSDRWNKTTIIRNAIISHKSGMAKYYQSKNGLRTFETRLSKVRTLYYKWYNLIHHVMNSVGSTHQNHSQLFTKIFDALMRIGFYGYMDIFADKICKKGDIRKDDDFMLMHEDIVSWIYAHAPDQYEFIIERYNQF